MGKEEKDIFIRAVHNIVTLIPLGRVTSYGAIAKAAGFPNFSRMVGSILSHSSEMALPAHRVTNSQGVLSGKSAFGSHQEMQSLLEAEGLTIKKDKIQNWRNVFWNPIDEILIE